MTDISLIQARDDGHLGERQQLLEKQKKRFIQLLTGRTKQALTDLWSLAPKHSRILRSCNTWEPRAPQPGLILPQPSTEQECCVFEAGRVWCLDLTGRVTKTSCVSLHGCKWQSGEDLLAAPQATSLRHKEDSWLIVRFWHLFWNVLMSGHHSYGYCIFNPHFIKIQSSG